MAAKISISLEQRDLLYERIYRHLAGIDSVWHAVSQREFDEADRLGRQLVDELTLVMDDLGWGEQCDTQPVEITASPEVMRRVLERLRDEAQDLEHAVDLRGPAEENRRLIEACKTLLASFERMETSK